MSNRLLSSLLVLALVTLSCNDGDDGESTAWQVSTIWPRGTRPAATPVHDDVLFVQEEAPAGLYLFQSGQAVHLNPGGPAVRSDYAWSSDGERFAFSSPGVPGDGAAGIYVGTRSAPTQVLRIWDRGSHPRFLPGSSAIICAGPSDGSEWSGIWQIQGTPPVPAPVASAGIAPEISPNGLKIAYLLEVGVVGGVLVVLDRVTARRDTLTGQVLNYSWLGDSETLVLEVLGNGGQEIRSIRAEAGAVPLFEQFGTRPAGFVQDDEFAFTGLVADRTDGIWIGAPRRGASHASGIGSWASPGRAGRVVAQGEPGLIVLLRP